MTSHVSGLRPLTAASSLAQLNAATRALKQPTPEMAREWLCRLLADPRLLTRHNRDRWQARPAFAAYWASYNKGFGYALRSYGPVTVAPALLDGHRHADLITGNTIVEIKSGRLDRRDHVEHLID